MSIPTVSRRPDRRPAPPRPVLPVPAYIIAGGRSSRFGSDKARALLAGVPLLAHAARAVAPFASSITVVAEVADKYADLGYRTIADRFPGLGPLAGLHSALCDAQDHDWLLLVSCDLIGVKARWLERLLAARRHAWPRVIAYRGLHWEPIPAIVRSDLRDLAARNLGAGNLALWQLIEQAGALALPLPHDWRNAVQVNTEEHLRACAHAT